MNSPTRTLRHASPVRAFEVEVRDVVRLSPSFVRIGFGGEALRFFDGGGVLGPRDTRIKVLLSEDGRGTAPVPDLSGSWYQRWRALEPAERGVLRTYTVRHADPGGPDPRVEVDFVVHLDHGRPTGPACRFAVTARPGDRAVLLGPNTEGGAYGGIEWQPPAPGPEPVPVLLAADETGVPAVCSILETLPPGYRGHAVLEVPEAGDFQSVRTAADVRTTWLARSGARHGDRLRGMVRELAPEAATPVRAGHEAVGGSDPDPEGPIWETSGAPGDGPGLYAWIAGESAMVRDVRRLLVGELGVARRRVAFMGYWRAGRPES